MDARRPFEPRLHRQQVADRQFCETRVAFVGGRQARGEEESEKKDDDKTSYHRIERSYGMIQRSIPMPCPLKQDGIAAAFAKGVLTVTLPKDAPAAPKAKRIAVKAA
ncbi:MAG: Hsp20 family protein [Alphaproteobacteria bacterium]